jgi:hypothetical protein
MKITNMTRFITTTAHAQDSPPGLSRDNFHVHICSDHLGGSHGVPAHERGMATGCRYRHHGNRSSGRSRLYNSTPLALAMIRRGDRRE